MYYFVKIIFYSVDACSKAEDGSSDKEIEVDDDETLGNSFNKFNRKLTVHIIIVTDISSQSDNSTCLLKKLAFPVAMYHRLMNEHRHWHSKMIICLFQNC